MNRFEQNLNGGQVLGQNRHDKPLVWIRLKGQEGREKEELLLFCCSYNYCLKNMVRT